MPCTTIVKKIYFFFCECTGPGTSRARAISSQESCQTLIPENVSVTICTAKEKQLTLTFLSIFQLVHVCTLANCAFNIDQRQQRTEEKIMAVVIKQIQGNSIFL